MSIRKLKLGETYVIRKGTPFAEEVECIDVATSGSIGMCKSMHGRIEVFVRSELDYTNEQIRNELGCNNEPMVSIWRD